MRSSPYPSSMAMMPMARLGNFRHGQTRTKANEKRLADIAIEVVYRAEVSYRESMERRFRWRKERKAQLEKELHQQEIAEERAERERIAKLQKERIEKLLGQAAAFEQARTIRRYVETMQVLIQNTDLNPTPKLKNFVSLVSEHCVQTFPSSVLFDFGRTGLIGRFWTAEPENSIERNFRVARVIPLQGHRK